MGNGGVIGKVNPVTIDRASGVYELEEVFLESLSESWPGSPPPLDVDFLAIGGGGGAVGYGTDYSMTGGGGAGGYLNSYGSELSGGSSDSENGKPDALALATATNYTVTVGAGASAGQNAGASSVISGTDRNGVNFSQTAAGGAGGGGTASGNANGTNGASGGGATYRVIVDDPPGFYGSYTGGTGTTSQGTDGGNAGGSTAGPYNSYWCSIISNADMCLAAMSYGGGGGGGAGAAGSDGSNSGGGNGGAGLASAITGTSVTRAGGGAGSGRVGGAGSDKVITNGSGGSGQSNAGGGANAGASDTAGNAGTVILRYPSAFTISFDGNVLTGSTTTDGDFKVTEFTAGTGTISFG